MDKFSLKNNKRYFILAIILGVSLMLNPITPVKANTELKDKIDVVSEKNTKEMQVKLTIVDSQNQELILKTQGITAIKEQELLAGVDTEFDGEVSVIKSDSEDSNQLKIQGGSKPLVLTLTVEKASDEESRMWLLKPDQSVIVEKELVFDVLTENSRETNEANLDEILSRQKRVPRGISEPPINSALLSSVFRAPIGTGPEVINGGRVLRITEDKTSQYGAIWSMKKLNLKKDFRLKSYLYMGNRQGSAGDGITFTLQNDPAMATNPSSVIGSRGMGLGAYYGGKSGDPYIKQALSIEFDTYHNSGVNDKMGKEISENGNKGHIAFVTPSKDNNSSSGQHSAVHLSPYYLSNGEWQELDITWESNTQTLICNFYGASMAQRVYRIDDLNRQFGGTEVYWGFTGSTGKNYAENAIAITQLPGFISQVAQIENLTQGSGRKTEVEGKTNDLVKLTDTIQFDANSIMNSDGMEVKVKLAEGLQYKPNTLTLNGEKIPASNIRISNNLLTVSNLNFSRADYDYKLCLDATVTSQGNDVQLKSGFDLISASNTLLSYSNPVIVKLPLRNGKLTVNYVDKDKNPIAPPNTISGKVGTAYNVSPLTIDSYIYDRVEGAQTGTFKDQDQEIFFYYKRAKANLTVQFLDEAGKKLYDPIVKEKTIGETVNLTTDNDVKNAISNVLLKRYQLKSSGRPTNETAVVIGSEGQVVKYIFEGTLSIYSGPRAIDFGSHEVSWKGMKNNNPTYDQPLVIWDNRKNLNNWRLSVKLEKDLSIPGSSKHILTDVLSYQTASGKRKLSTDAQEIINTKHGTSGQYDISAETWGPDKQGLRLDVPSGAVKLTGDYETTLIWRVEEVY